MIQLFNIDCMVKMAEYPDKYFDLAIVDPPYGININPNMGLKKGQRKRHASIDWDDAIPDMKYFDELMRVSVNCIIWGGQYFPLGITKHYIVWDKQMAEGMTFADFELAWTTFNKANRKYSYRNIFDDKIHPTQKPVQLYKWLLANYAKPTDKIIDTHLGSGSSAIAAYDFGCAEFVGCEIDKDYYDAAVKRFETHKMQLTMF